MVDPLCWRRKSGHLHPSNNPSTFPSMHIASLYGRPRWCLPLFLGYTVDQPSFTVLWHGQGMTGWASTTSVIRSRPGT